MFKQRMADLCLLKEPEKVIVFYRHGLLFAFNFNPTQSYTNILVPVPNKADYTVALSSDDEKYGGWNQVEHITYPVKVFEGKSYVELYLPARTAVVLREGEIQPSAEEKSAEEAPKKATRKKAVKAEDGEEAPKKTTRKKAVKAEDGEEAPKKTTRKRTTKKAEETPAEAPAAETPAAE